VGGTLGWNSFVLGGYDNQLIKGESDLTWSYLYNTSLDVWAIPLQSFLINSTSYTTTAKYAIVDSGSYFVKMNP